MYAGYSLNNDGAGMDARGDLCGAAKIVGGDRKIDGSCCTGNVDIAGIFAGRHATMSETGVRGLSS